MPGLRPPRLLLGEGEALHRGEDDHGLQGDLYCHGRVEVDRKQSVDDCVSGGVDGIQI